MFENDLKQLGLSDKEAKVYLAVLELGPSTAIQIAQKAEINRPTSYVQIERLMKRGLMSSQARGKKTYFAAESPERLQELVRKNQLEIAEQSKRLTEILPELQDLFASAQERPKVRFYEGKDGIMAMADDIYKVKDKKILTITSDDLVSKTFSKKERDEFERIRAKRGISTRELYTKKTGPFTTPAPPTVQDRFIPEDKFPITAGVDIYDNKVAAYTLSGRLVGAIIESREIADTLRSVFELAWNSANNYQNKQAPPV